MRCFVGFFGITRGFRWTIDSIEKNIFAPLDRAGIDQVRAAHFNVPDFIHAPRSGEYMVPFDVGDISRLGLHMHALEEQKIDGISTYLPIIMNVNQKGEVDEGGIARINALFQMYSQKKLAAFLYKSGIENFDFVILLRPDLRYIDPIPIKRILAQIKLPNASKHLAVDYLVDAALRKFKPRVDMITPNWHKWDGLNDRFAFLTPTAALIYLNRIDYLEQFCSSIGYFESELLLKFVVEKSGLLNSFTRMRGERVRSNGVAEPKDRPDRKARIHRLALGTLYRSWQI